MAGPDPGISCKISSGLRCAAPEDDVFPLPARKRQLLRDHFTERQISPPITQPAVVSVSPESVIVPE